MLKSNLKTALGDKRIYCFINIKFYEPYRKFYIKNFARDRFDIREYTIFYLTKMRGECSVFNKEVAYTQ